METSIVCVETFKGEAAEFGSGWQRAGSARSWGRLPEGALFLRKWKLLSSDRLLPPHTFPTEGDAFPPPGRHSLWMADEMGEIGHPVPGWWLCLSPDENKLFLKDRSFSSCFLSMSPLPLPPGRGRGAPFAAAAAPGARCRDPPERLGWLLSVRTIRRVQDFSAEAGGGHRQVGKAPEESDLIPGFLFT